MQKKYHSYQPKDILYMYTDALHTSRNQESIFSGVKVSRSTENSTNENGFHSVAEKTLRYSFFAVTILHCLCAALVACVVSQLPQAIHTGDKPFKPLDRTVYC